MALIPCLVVSTLFMALTCALAEVLRKVAHSLIPPGLSRLLADELIAGAELCGCCLELIIVADNYGVTTYAGFLFLLTIWWACRWGEATACPYTYLEDYLLGGMTAREVLLRTVAALAGGVLVFRYVQVLWGLELAETHTGRPHSSSYGHCVADLTVPVWMGFMIEGVATLLCRLTSKLLSDVKPKYAGIMDSFIATSLVVAAFSTSGGYFNPVLATGLKFGCQGHTHLEHGLVYWLGSSLGAVASVYLYPGIKHSFGLKDKYE